MLSDSKKILLKGLFAFVLAFSSFSLGQAEEEATPPSLSWFQRIAQSVKDTLSFSDTKEHSTSRRGFLKKSGGLAAGAALASTGGLATGLLKAPAPISKAAMKKLARLRLSTLTEPLKGERGLKGLAGYIKDLRRLKVSDPSLKRLIAKRALLAEKSQKAIKAAQAARALQVSQQKALAQKAQSLSSKATPSGVRPLSSAPSSSSTALNLKQQNQILHLREQLFNSLEKAPLELQLVMVRQLLSPRLLRRMSWQVQFVDLEEQRYPLVLTENDVALLEEHRSLLEEISPKLESQDEFTKRLHKSFLEEASLSLEHYYLASDRQTAYSLQENKSLSCKKLL